MISDTTLSKLKKYFGPLLFIVAIAFVVIPMLTEEKGQYDFQTIHAGASAYGRGLNPYDTNDLSKVAGEHIELPYVFPPLTLVIFQPLTLFSYQAASVIFLAFKIFFLALLMILWLRIFGFHDYRIFFFILCIFAFGGTLQSDLRAGNISLFEQVVIWSGFFFYLKNKPQYFLAAILLVSVFKLTPILLLGFLLLDFKRQNAGYAALGLVLFLIMIGCNALFFPQLFSSFLHNSSAFLTLNPPGERGALNPATLPLIKDLLASFIEKIPFLPYTIFFIIAGAAIAISVRVLKKFEHVEKYHAGLWKICLACFLYALISPRFKNYSYILLIAPAFFIIINGQRKKTFLLLSLLLIIFANRNYEVFWGRLRPLTILLSEYNSLIIAWLLWGFCCYTIFAMASRNKLE